MNINFTNKTNKNKIYFVINWKHKIKDKKTINYIEKLRFEKWEQFKIEELNYIENNKKHTDIVVIVKNNKKLEENLEDIVVKLWNIIIKKNEKFSLSLKKLNIDPFLQEMFVELLAQKLYKYTEFKDNKIKYSINIDANIDEEKVKLKINSIYFARDLQNKPANVLNPETYEQFIKDTFKNNKNVKIKIIKWEELKKMWANGIYSVGKWSQYEPRMIILEYKVTNNNTYKALVGKWVTFDAWGYNLKPTGYIEDMHLDMWWSAIALASFKYLVESGYKDNLICAIWVVENLVSHKAYSPTDIIKMYNGKTVQVANTDAEWRLVLADVLSYIEDKYNLNLVFDFATLTWAAVVALWGEITAIMWRNEKLLKKIKEESWKLKEYTWELPLFKKYKEHIKANFADIKNLGKGREAGTITAGLFLAEFIKNENWIHFDIAWPNIMKNHPLYGTGGTWIQIRLVTKILEN